MDDHQFRQLLQRFGLEWEGYRRVRKGVKRRIYRHIQELGFRNMEDYFLALDKDHEMRDQCERLMSVSISRFFRDRSLWQALENPILPGIIEKNKERVRVWSAGCACGEEVYSLKILWDGLRDRFECLPDLELLATDRNPLYLDKAQAGIYSRSSLREVPEEMLSTYFIPKKGSGHYLVVPSVKKGITWKVHNLLNAPPEADFHLIFLRNNLLTYYGHELKGLAFRKVVDRLVPGGLLIIGTHERSPLAIPGLITFSNHPYILQRAGENSKRRNSNSLALL